LKFKLKLIFPVIFVRRCESQQTIAESYYVKHWRKLKVQTNQLLLAQRWVTYM